MSLSSVYYQCSDGKVYRDPTWRTADAFVCSDDEDPLELVVVKPKGCKPAQAQQLAMQKLAELGIAAELLLDSYFGRTTRCFNSVHDIRPAFRYFLRITAPLPPPTEPPRRSPRRAAAGEAGAAIPEVRNHETRTEV